MKNMRNLKSDRCMFLRWIIFDVNGIISLSWRVFCATVGQKTQQLRYYLLCIQKMKSISSLVCVMYLYLCKNVVEDYKKDKALVQLRLTLVLEKAFIVTRSIGASLIYLFIQPKENGGVGISVAIVNIVFLYNNCCNI